ncbi:MAG: tRNA (adenosine(37)-N6)-threonylcarbamoyltransferase complex ATPase subunit type 1 TsaE [Leptospiraceae bacterium]|nr:tRNA (adenosine(37)-N6)-threonylcarbamoyltransferase complex ATPase subunit type 1 TsaE [Leptospiraceae bacterium]MDW8306440.1 tRNA (adenosine(37)-N6)-threonylcarbamoyltransferase complex ATPase subunit type 1 TsaE [Leptospiraceae bacterium]
MEQNTKIPPALDESVFLSYSEEDTRELAKELATKIHPPLFILLKGELGTGKTSFTRYLVEALGYKGVVNSPSFALHQIYEIKRNLNFHHLDLYRLQNEHYEELFSFTQAEDNFIAAVEWPEIAEGYILSLGYPVLFLHFRYYSQGRQIIIKNFS